VRGIGSRRLAVRPPRWTLRLRLTLLYGALFMVAGAVLLAITYGLVSHSSPVTRTESFIATGKGGPRAVSPPLLPKSGGALIITRSPNGPAIQLRDYAGKLNATFKRAQQVQIRGVAEKAKAALNQQRTAELDSLLTKSGIALAIMAILSVGFGWLMAGRALRPVRTMSARARGISERNLHERLALDGPNDELKELGDTFDELLARLEKAFESQRRFVSNASHELRTPITLERTLVEVALADREASVDSLRDTCRRVLAAGEQQERLIEALLTLARSQRGIASREQLDLGAIAADVIGGVESNGVRLEPHLDRAETAGDHRLVERLIANLVDNALKYNSHGGWMTVRTGMREGRAMVEVVNTGPPIPADQVGGLLEPFRRLNGDRGIGANQGGDGSTEPVARRGLGLGLSIVDAIATAHGARLHTAPRAEGGLLVQVSFPARPGLSLD
jgi:signal transduction histidine kinase